MENTISTPNLGVSRKRTLVRRAVHVSLALAVVAATNLTLHAQYNGSFVDIQPVPGLETANTRVRFPRAISDDGLTMWLMDGSNRSDQRVDLFEATRSSVSEPFTSSLPIDALNLGPTNFAFEVSSDGLTSYFCSVPTSGAPRMWTSSRESAVSTWDDPELFEIDGTDACQWPKLSHDQLTMYFGRNRVSVASRESVAAPFGEPEALRGVSGVSAISTDELAILFPKTTGSPQDGTADTMIATRVTKDDLFGRPVRLDDFGLGSNFESEWGFVDSPVLSADWPADGSKIYFSAGKSARFGQTLTVYEATWNVYADGDANLDDEVNFADFLILAKNFGQDGAWREGDFDGDGTVRFSDFLALGENFGRAATALAASVPEPTAANIATFGLLGLIGFRKRR